MVKHTCEYAVLRATGRPWALLAALLLLAGAAVAYNVLCPGSGFTCELWSCSRSLIGAAEEAWPAPRPELTGAASSRWRRLHEAHVREAQHHANSSKLVFLGDSITEGWLRTGFSARAQSIQQPACEAIWKRAFGKWNALNFGVGGDRVQDLGWRLQHGLLAAAALQPRVFALLIGTNDLGHGEAAAVALTEVRTLVEQLRRARPAATVLVQAVLPRGSDDGTPRTPSFRRGGWWDAQRNSYHADVGVINAGLRAFAAARAPHVRFVDCGPRLLRAAPRPGAQLAAGGTSNATTKRNAAGYRQQQQQLYLPVEWMYDLLHLSPAGYERWAACLAEVLPPLLDGGSGGGGSNEAAAS